MTYGKPIVVEEEYPQPDGSIEYSQVVKTPVFDGDHKVIGSQGMLFDITLQKQLQVELIRAKDRAEDSDRLKTAFLHNISHEIRTPMNAIVGFSGFLNEENLTPDKSKIYTEVIVQSSRQLLSIIDDIVRIATIEAGQETIKEVDFQLNVLCTMAYQQFADEAEKAGIEFRLQPGLSDQEDWILTDQTKILEVFSNLLVNALKFTKQGHVCLGYELKGETLEFFVEDTGVGIRKELQDDIFKRFRQADSTLSRQFGGSGLGLSICKAYIELLGGRIWVDSEVGVGSVFRFTIPYKKSTMNKNVELLSSCEGERTDSESRQYSVLVAEDEDLNFILLREILSPLDMSVVRAINGKEAVDMVKKRKDIDLVLMDLKMPVMDGYEAAALIKEECPNLPILALTAYSHESDKRRAYACGCSDFISKPFRKADLIEKMKLHLHQA
jgi:signal transduction histidine kinase